MPFARFRYPAAGCLPTRSSTRHGEPTTKVIPLAEGEKDQRIREGEGYRLKRVKGAEGDAATTVSRRNWR